MAPVTTIESRTDTSPRDTTSLRSVSAATSTETIDIIKSRKLLRRISESALTPRKRALARKASTTADDELTPTGPSGSPPSPSPKVSSEELSTQADRLSSSEGRATLFQFPKAEIFTFDDHADSISDSKSQGRLLGHGRFEVFQLHQQKVTYLQCGSVVHPILPRLKILKISKNQFILPLSNPERYWRIVIATGNPQILKGLEGAFSKVCHFRNLHIQTTEDQQILPLVTDMPIIQPIHFTKSELKTSESLTSITTAVACFNLESDSSTFVDDAVPMTTPNSLKRVDSKASSLDLALDSFFEDPEPSQYFTPDHSVLLTHHDEESRDTITLSPVLSAFSSLPLPKRRTQSRSSRSASLYQSESSWMDPVEDVRTSTPATQRYVKLNLNPTPRSKGKLLHENNEAENIAEPILRKASADRSKYRYSSFDVYNMVKEASVDDNDAEPSFRSFLKSFF